MHLVTGGNGYVGGFVVRALLAKGEKVRVLDLFDIPERPREAEFIQCDIMDREALRRAMKGVTIVHHTAALVPLKKAGDRFWEVNVEGTRNVVDVARQCGVEHLVHMSSSALFGNVTEADCPIKAEMKPHPVEIYGRSKHAGEQVVLEAMESGFSCSIIRPRTIVGTERLGIFQILFEWLHEGRNIYIIGDGSNLFQFIHIDDLVESNNLSALKKVPGVFNIGTDRYGTLREDLSALCKHAATGAQVKGIPVWLAMNSLLALDKLGLSPLGPWHYMTYHKPFHYDLSLPKEKLGWKPKYSNQEMLIQSYEWYLQNKARLEALNTGSAHRSILKQGVLGLIKKFS